MREKTILYLSCWTWKKCVTCTRWFWRWCKKNKTRPFVFSFPLVPWKLFCRTLPNFSNFRAFSRHSRGSALHFLLQNAIKYLSYIHHDCNHQKLYFQSVLKVEWSLSIRNGWLFFLVNAVSVVAAWKIGHRLDVGRWYRFYCDNCLFSIMTVSFSLLVKSQLGIVRRKPPAAQWFAWLMINNSIANPSIAVSHFSLFFRQ